MNFNKPENTDLYTQLLTDIRTALSDLAKMNHSSSTNVPTGAKQWSDANGRFEEFDGTTWNALLAAATTTVAGLVMLSNSTSSTSETTAATSRAVKDLSDAVLKLNGSAAMTGDLDMGSNDIDHVTILRAGNAQQARMGFWNNKGQIWCSVGGLDIGSDGSGEDLNFYTRTAGGVTRKVAKLTAEGDLHVIGNVLVNQGTV